MYMNVKKTTILIVTLISQLFFSTGSIYAQGTTFEAKVNSVIKEEGNYQNLELEGVNGDYKNRIIQIENGLFDSANNIKYKVGDKVVVTKESYDGQKDYFTITDYVRRSSLALLLFIFLILAITIAGKWGLTSIVGMAYSFYVIFVFILPMILKGYDAVVVAVIGSMFIIPVTFGLSHGINRKTINAVIGTIISMVIVGILSVVFVNLTKLTGFAVEEAGFLQYQLGGIINMKGILLAGIIISTLGVMDDITVSQASVAEELKKANPKLSKSELFLRSMRVGKDHISSMVNTLVLVYAGASLPLLLLFVNNPHPFSEVINYEIISDEIVRTLVGSIGLILAVPITTYIAVHNLKK